MDFFSKTRSNGQQAHEQEPQRHPSSGKQSPDHQEGPLTPAGGTITQAPEVTRSGEAVEEREAWCPVGGNVTCPPCDPAIPLWGLTRGIEDGISDTCSPCLLGIIHHSQATNTTCALQRVGA